MIRFDNFLMGVSAAAFVVSMFASALSNVFWFGLMTSLVLGVLAAGLRSRRGISLHQNIATAAATAGIVTLILTAAFVSTYFVNRENAYFEAHLFDHPVPWWAGALFIILFMGGVFGITGVIGHFLNRRFLSKSQRTKPV